MSFFDFFKRKNKTENTPQSTMQKLADRYLVETGSWIPLGAPERNYKITDMKNHCTFTLNVSYKERDVSDLRHQQDDGLKDYCSVHVSVSTDKENDTLKCAFSEVIYQKDFEKIIGFSDVDLAMYNQLKAARQDSSNPQRQEEAYLVSTLLRAAHDNIWLAPLLQHKNTPENSEKLKQIKIDAREAANKAHERIQSYKQKREEKQESEREREELFPWVKKPKKRQLSEDQVRQQNSQYIQSLMKENFVDGL